MKNLISERFSLQGLMLLLSLFIVLHLSILFGVIPFNMVWGGRLKDHAQMVSFETVSIVLNLFMLIVVAIRGNFLRVKVHPVAIKAVLWIMVALFLLNTLGNLLSTNLFEKAVFTPVTLVMAVFCWRLTSHSPR